MPIYPVKRINVTDQVFDQLKSAIICGDFSIGEKLPSENELAVRFGVSRVTVRQALQKLTVLGLIETKLGEGSFVATMKPGIYMSSIIPLAYLGQKSTIEVVEFRKIIETESIAIAAKRANAREIASLEKNVEKMIMAEGDAEKFRQLDLIFHMKIAQMTKNSLIIETHNILKDILNVAMKDINYYMGYKGAIHFHPRMLEAIKERDGEKAKMIMSEHLKETIEGIESFTQTTK